MKTKGRGRRRTLNRDFGRCKKDETIERTPSHWLEDSQLQNDRFEEYYRAQGIIEDQDWAVFLRSMRTELPVVFRINGRGPFSENLREKLQTDFFQKMAADGVISPPRPLLWYPQKLAWQFDFCRRELRRDSNFEKLHEYIKKETSNGSISRQEAVSMIPPLVLDVHPHHRVLDMCAAPGSKTAQLLEMLHGDPTAQPDGVVLANDVDYKRCNMMTHQIRRMISPNVLVASADAALFPGRLKGSGRSLWFDRILVDVPCSGDGTTRKNPEVWRKWKLHDAVSLHSLQLRIAMRAVKLLAPGGLLAYSTCSLNPLEDEAVVAELCRQSNGRLELLDLSSQLPDLVCCPGKRKWIVQDDHQRYQSFQEVQNLRQEKKKKILVEKSFFPPSPEEDIPLERCIRLLPHLNNSGGFFVAALRKINTSDGDSAVEKKIDEDPFEGKKIDENFVEEKKIGEVVRSSQESYFKGIDPIIDLEGHHLVQEVTEFYGLEGVDLGKNLISRKLINDEPKKVYFVSSSVKALLIDGLDKTLRITSLGQQVLTRQDQRKEGSVYPCIYRFCQDGLQLVLPHITKQKIFLSFDWMLFFLRQKALKIPRSGEEVEEASLVKDPMVIESIRSLKQGGCVVLLDDEDAERLKLPLSTEARAGLTSHSPIAVAGWMISPYSLNLMVCKEDTQNLIEKLVDSIVYSFKVKEWF